MKPSRFLSKEAPDNMVLAFSKEASGLMAERAKNTYGAFRSLAAELKEFELPVLVKMGYGVDGGGSDDLEHLWFEVHEMEDGRLEATLTNEPFGIARMKQGQRGWHEVGLMTDWTILTPIGQITPRSMLPARIIRAHRDEFRDAMRQSRQEK